MSLRYLFCVLIVLPQLSCAAPSDQLYLNYFSLLPGMNEVTISTFMDSGEICISDASSDTPILSIKRRTSHGKVVKSMFLDVVVERVENGVTISERLSGKQHRRLLDLSLGEEPQIVCYEKDGKKSDIIRPDTNPGWMCIRGDQVHVEDGLKCFVQQATDE